MLGWQFVGIDIEEVSERLPQGWEAREIDEFCRLLFTSKKVPVAEFASVVKAVLGEKEVKWCGRLPGAIFNDPNVGAIVGPPAKILHKEGGRFYHPICTPTRWQRALGRPFFS